jgi:methylenetetrahydrofolate dehydrogenase (NADP+)/methenyltetrahydrofolate cyclohydrolase
MTDLYYCINIIIIQAQIDLAEAGERRYDCQMKMLNGSELAGFIKQRQGGQVRALRQAHKIIPKLAIIQANDDPVINTYVRLKKQYGADILVDVEAHVISQDKIAKLLQKLNSDPSVHGIIIQLPLTDTSETDKICALVDPKKDVDGLGSREYFEPATPLAILWLLSGYNIELKGKHILLVGRGKLVGKPLNEMLVASGYDVEMIGRVEDLASYTQKADVIITATGNPGIVTSEMVKEGAVVVDAGTASESGKTVGDLHQDIYERDDLTITPQKGGVGPLTVCALFENVITSAQRQTK